MGVCPPQGPSEASMFSYSISFYCRRNIYSEELLKMIYIDQDLEFMKDVDAMSKMDTDQKESTNTVYDQRNGVRCIR